MEDPSKLVCSIRQPVAFASTATVRSAYTRAMYTASRPSLEGCPPEVLSQIVAEVCTDGGRSALALCLTSRYVAAVAEPLKFRAVAVAGPRQVEALMHSLQSASAQARANVRHLFFSDRPAGAPAPLDYPHSGAPRELLERPGPPAVHQVHHHEATVTGSLLAALLALVPSRLVTFTCIVSNPHFTHALLAIARVPFPALAAFTLALPAPPHPASDLPAPGFLDMPNLRTFHVGTRGRLKHHTPLLDCVLSACPVLDELCLTDVEVRADTPAVLRALVRSAASLKAGGADASTPPSGARILRVTVQPELQRTPFGGCVDGGSVRELLRMHARGDVARLVVGALARRRSGAWWRAEWERGAAEVR